MEKIGFVGTGAMGSALLSRLKLANVTALAFDIAPAALQARLMTDLFEAANCIERSGPEQSGKKQDERPAMTDLASGRLDSFSVTAGRAGLAWTGRPAGPRQRQTTAIAFCTVAAIGASLSWRLRPA